jgi:hypothetical protein
MTVSPRGAPKKTAPLPRIRAVPELVQPQLRVKPHSSHLQGISLTINAFH